MLDPGTRVEGYVVGRLLGEGGTASVYAVRHALLDTWHALKVLHTSDAATQDRLIREGRVQSRLDPALIVPVTDVILAHGAPALVLPLVRGMSLDSLLIDGPPTELEALSLFHAICTSVAHAHSHGIVHRDLKPANVLVDADQGRLRLRVADFGLVRAVADDELGANGGVRTRRGSMMGSPAYAAPEQLSAATRADRRADVWSLGVILYELLTGKRPFDGESLRDLIANVQNGDLNLDPVPTVHRAWIAQLLSVDPDGRPHNATEVLERVPAPEALPIDGPFGSRLVIPDLPAPPSVRSIAVTPPPAAPAIPDPAPRPTAVHAHIPAERSRLLGRAEDLKQLHAVVRSGARLATLTGIGGTGKTRLVIHFAWSVVEDWPGGVWFCDLTEARSLAGLASAVAGALGVVIDNGDPVARITDGLLARGRCLIVLDNFEQVTEHAAATVGRWLDGAPDSAFIITSREVLGVRGERVLPVPPLAPDSAVELFLERARAARPDFKPNESEKGFIEQLVTKMDHLPLAIELAAARVRTLSPERMLQRMDDRFRLLTTRGRKDRASTLRATLDWSWDLLDTPEKETLAQLSIFEGGFTLDAAEEIVQLSDPEAWVLDTVEALVDKSLVRTLPHERFGMLVTVQAYAQEKRQASPDPAGIIER
ncbi:MAG: protein kinase, partial [Myxococcota bacterium]